MIPSNRPLEGKIGKSQEYSYSKLEYGIKQLYQGLMGLFEYYVSKYIFLTPRMYNVYIHDFSMISRVQLYIYTYADEDHVYEEAS